MACSCVCGGERGDRDDTYNPFPFSHSVVSTVVRILESDCLDPSPTLTTH